ncbi:OLC1v1016850C2 [Oldenlandia corymbosa var. corymbosa]|uniref:OLC1v1016850C2 n=1 Tax=Oldenlandia corymbosa var. corymbosa TaxID=529605 RepID=A0AAV1E850_OLDCO|nr:OLC1v1016850C2 [Oldenlandia corymbosa var. corymbosa]
MAAPFLRSLPVFRQRLLHLHHCRSTISAFTLGRPWSTVTESTRPDDDTTATSTTQNVPAVSAKEIPKHHPRFDDPNYRKWKDKEALIWSDIEDVTSIVKEILHSERYMDGERLTPEDEKIVVERLLAYHPHSDDKIGCGLDSIMVSCIFNGLVDTYLFNWMDVDKLPMLFRLVYSLILAYDFLWDFA